MNCDLQIFLPHTAFHLASYVRSLRNAAFYPKKLIVLIGLGTTASPVGDAYVRFLCQEIQREKRDIEVDIIKIKGFYSLFSLAPFLFSRYQFVVANLRRTESLILAKFSDSVVVVDEGEGTAIKGGYLDPRVPEKSRIKRFLSWMSMIPKYSKMSEKVVSHHTIYDWSIYKNFSVIPFSVVAPDSSISLPRVEAVRIFVSSFAFLVDRNEYLAWAKKKISHLERLEQGAFYFAPHPACSEDLVEFLTKNLGLEKIPRTNLLLEEFVFYLCKNNIKVELVGEANSSTRLLGKIQLPGLTLMSSRYGS